MEAMSRYEQAGRIVAISISRQKGVPKTNVPAAVLLPEWGIAGDAHAGPWHRQVSLLAVESIAKMQAKGLRVSPGAFAENLTTEGFDVPNLHVGERLAIGDVLLEVTQIGKQCHHRCAIFEQAGDCVMPREGVFARVIRGGEVKVGDSFLVHRADEAMSQTPATSVHVSPGAGE